MSKAEYLEKLRRNLRALPENSAKDALEYYEDYLSEAEAGQDLAGAMERLGTPNEVAAKILAEFAVADIKVSETEKTDKPHRGGMKVALGITLTIFAVPVGVPVAAAVGVIAIALLVVLFSGVLSFFCAGAGLAIGGAASFIAGIIALIQNTGVGLMALGMGIAALGFGIVFLKLTAVLARGGSHFIAGFVGRRILRRGSK